LHQLSLNFQETFFKTTNTHLFDDSKETLFLTVMTRKLMENNNNMNMYWMKKKREKIIGWKKNRIYFLCHFYHFDDVENFMRLWWKFCEMIEMQYNDFEFFFFEWCGKGKFVWIIRAFIRASGFCTCWICFFDLLRVSGIRSTIVSIYWRKSAGTQTFKIKNNPPNLNVNHLKI
jgi:hypothetical protein